MFITYNQEGKVTAYGDGPRNPLNFQEGEVQTEVDYEFTHLDCTEDSLQFHDGVLSNHGEVIAHEIVPEVPEESSEEPNQPE